MNRIDLTDSKEWYLTPEQAKAYLDLMSKDYASGIVSAEDRLLEKNLESISGALPRDSCYVDLGPGNGKKTLFLSGRLFDRARISSYVGVDVQPEFLSVCDKVHERLGIPSTKIISSFEDFLTRPGAHPGGPAFIYLGATYGNFSRNPIEPLLFDFMIPQDTVYLSSELYPLDLDDMIRRYSLTSTIFDPVAKGHGINNGKFSVRFNQELSSIEQGYVIDDNFYVLGISRKPTPEAFRNQVSGYFEGKYFIEGFHIGFLGRKGEAGR